MGIQDSVKADLAEVFCWWFNNDTAVVSQLRKEWSGSQQNWGRMVGSKVHRLEELSDKWFTPLEAMDDDSISQILQRLIESRSVQKHAASMRSSVTRTTLLNNLRLSQGKKRAVWERLSFVILYVLIQRNYGFWSESLHIEKFFSACLSLARDFIYSKEIRSLDPIFQLPILMALHSSERSSDRQLLKSYMKSSDFAEIKGNFPCIQEFCKLVKSSLKL